MNDVFNFSTKLYAQILAERLARKFPAYKFETDGNSVIVSKPVRLFRKSELISMFSCAEVEGKVEPMLPMKDRDVPKMLFYANEISQECIRIARKNSKGENVMITDDQNKITKTILTLASYLNMNYADYIFLPNTSLRLIEMASCDDERYIENILWFTDDGNVELMYRTDDASAKKVLARAKTKIKEWSNG